MPGTPRTDPYVSTLPHTAPTSGRRPGALACGLPHTSQSDQFAFPARCPGRSRLTGVSLGRTPSLHKLRRLVVFVRSLHRYYGSVRLPNTVHTGITDLPSPAVPPVFTSGRCWGLSVLVHETSRSPGSRDSARSDCHSPFASQPILPPPWHHKSSTWKPFLSKLNSPACAPLSTLRQPVTRTRRMTRGRGGWLALPRTALSSAVSCRFIPTLSVPPTFPRLCQPNCSGKPPARPYPAW